MVNELRATYLRRKFIDRHPGLGENLAGSIGLKGVSDQAFPVFNIPGYGPSQSATASAATTNFGTASLSSPTVARVQTPITDRQILESVSWSRGMHAFKFGGEFRIGVNDETRDRRSSGNLTFSPLITSNLGAANTGNALASFLLGEVNSASVQMSDLIQTRAYIGLVGSTKLDVRVEAYNLLNRANFSIPGFTLGTADFGVISSTRSARTVQIGTRLSF